MIQISANEIKQNFGRVLENAQREPIVIQRYNRDAAVLLSMSEYEKLTAAHVEAFERFCDSVAEKAKARGLTEEKLSELLSN